MVDTQARQKSSTWQRAGVNRIELESGITRLSRHLTPGVLWGRTSKLAEKVEKQAIRECKKSTWELKPPPPKKRTFPACNARYSARSVEAGSVRRARRVAGKAAMHAATTIAAAGSASMEPSVGLTW